MSCHQGQPLARVWIRFHSSGLSFEGWWELARMREGGTLQQRGRVGTLQQRKVPASPGNVKGAGLLHMALGGKSQKPGC